MSLIMNEKIKSKEVELTGIDGESLGVVARDEALAMAKRLKADLVCTSLMSSPPPCKLVSRGEAKREQTQQKREERLQEQPAKEKELRLSASIEEHDYDTKRRQAEKLLASGNPVLLVVRLKGKQEQVPAKELLERLAADLKPVGSKATGVQVSGKQAAVRINPAG
ncbi:translation initiation factor IF-3 [Paenibacillus curdlanolyticus YK9]|uniref:Translation initiation factor IF-3 n=1 Tax=Paenibacillus curdlanolyticus YK9 TaxID=717606 RepID=E0IA10_9BACL|nr:translation initiation factor IF-3 [Paenibacillus curdlanolyticus]EFM10587.1 translation initiation factor IF-3 [Paenibacillus curdlanolyticus YK9]